MKRILIAVATSLVCVVLYYFVVYAISPFVLGTPPLTSHPSLYAPISIPARFYQAVAPDTIQNFFAATPGGGMVEGLIFLVSNVALLSIPICGVFALTSRKQDT